MIAAWPIDHNLQLLSAGYRQCGGTRPRLVSTNSTKRRQQCPIAPKVLDMAEPRDAQSVIAGLVSSGTTRGELPCVPGSASIASELAGKVTAIGCAGSKSPPTSYRRTARGPYDVPDLTTRRIFGNSTDVAPRYPDHDRLCGCGSA